MAQQRRPKIRQADIRALPEKQNYRCALTGRPITPETAVVDHKLPVSRGGDHSIENLWVVHADVNTAKRTLTVEEFVQMCHEVVEHYGSNR